jgi:hypothetical protein
LVNTAMSVVPPPMSTRQTPSSFSSVGQHRVAGRELLEDDVLHLEAAALDALDDVLRGADRAGDHVHLGLQPHAGHAQRLLDAFLVVDDVFLRQDVQDLLVGRNRTACAASITRSIFGAYTSGRWMATMPCELRLRMWLPAIPA